MSEVTRLLALFDTCQETLVALEGRPVTRDEREIVAAIRDTCRDIEARLTELGVPFEDRTVSATARHAAAA
jgi:hypothetical protein